MAVVTVAIGGMSCGHCVGRVKGALEAVPGVRVEGVEIGSARVEVDPERAPPGAVERAVEEAGFVVKGVRP